MGAQMPQAPGAACTDSTAGRDPTHRIRSHSHSGSDGRNATIQESTMTTTGKKPATKAVTRDPRGGLTAAGRAEFHATQGSNLKPGVTKRISEMTPDEMRRKGSWATRFFGRDPLPPLRDDKGKPTRFALSAHAWGEPVPRTEAAARRIADKGRRLLARYQRLKAT